MDRSMDNDTRGWIMSGISGVACVIGASIIYSDVLVRAVWENSEFNIQRSNAFLACSMSLSFGVMIFSALYSILPSSKKYLMKAEFSSSTASWILLACFVGGFVGITVVSRFLHHYMPSHVEHCDHTHKGGELNNHEHNCEDGHDHDHGRAHSHSSHGTRKSRHDSHLHKMYTTQNGNGLETTPLLASSNGANGRVAQFDGAGHSRQSSRPNKKATSRRPSMLQVQQKVMSFVKDTKPNCDGQGPCYGYSDPCGSSCFKHLSPRPSLSSQPTIFPRGSTGAIQPLSYPENHEVTSETHSPTRTRLSHASSHNSLSIAADSEDLESQREHHHHVPDKAFLNLGIQTSIAIAVHKLPEGFITYATNHANPSLGFSIFMALFVHNISEGFSLAVPLYLALNSRFKAMAWAALLGGASQPLGAAVAALWLKISGHQGHEPGVAIYGCMFGVTSGIMVFVALNMFVEGVGLNHNTNVCIAWAFLGMGIMGVSSALTA